MFSGGIQVLIQAVYDIGIPILDTTTWVYQNQNYQQMQFQFF